ncbi:MAG: DUF1365 domain-containing protein [Xanthomonadales bacterium]|nr:DUF1365 domain-containing protein [Xanthomonadales bacterium]
MHSAIYQGTIQHRRKQPREHEFSYSMFMLYLDLDELPELFDRSRWFSARPFSVGNFALARFLRQDHMGDANLPLSHCVRELVAKQTGQRPQGPIRLLTNLRYFGYGFNPVSFYYCFDQIDGQLECVVAEVNNTPWGEQHCYVLSAADDLGKDGLHRWQQAKAMHVSPFMPMQMHYEFRLLRPGDLLNVYMQNYLEGEMVFDAGLHLQRQEITARTLRNSLLRFPFMTLQIIVAIHWQALRLWLKGVPIHDHPDKNSGKSGGKSGSKSNESRTGKDNDSRSTHFSEGSAP